MSSIAFLSSSCREIEVLYHSVNLRFIHGFAEALAVRPSD